MFLSNVLLKKAKSKFILVLLESVASGHRVIRCRERVSDKLEVVIFDPYVQDKVLYREWKKIKSL
ncbi:39S ribosomal protein L33, mitochondrial [Eufriesea mexicana]|uniref:Large ribosomal subunit protein bL33m n=1 Tax=Eufriesea mexicana TaxID=516756 RepID=A0A310SV46_9HYME|nr:PREDICTED: 39S ribosomal protein L33, mitochondrial [Eufriesea mexicana]OAD62075.1 39S ribosomal protein L33, mitochondrial [Eufriesea mexicana]